MSISNPKRISFSKNEYCVVGSGMTGSTIARILADNGHIVTVLEKRRHIAGNMYDPVIASGHRIHMYGPHAFHTNSDKVFDFLSRFTEWNDYEHKVVANIHGNIVPIPFNFNSISLCFDNHEEIIFHLKSKYKDNEHVPVLKLLKSDNDLERSVAEYAYDNVFKQYTKKQWDMYPDEINPSVTARVPIRMGYDDRYFLDKYQAIPSNGYVGMIENMLDHKNITTKTSTEFVLENYNKYKKVFFTGPVDELLGYQFNILPYRSLVFRYEEKNGDTFLPTGHMNFTVDQEYTRISDYGLMNGQELGTTIIAKEYSENYIPHVNEPFYPIPNDEPRELHKKYIDFVCENYPNIILAGRLADYKYYNMDQACARGIQASEMEL